MEGPKVGDAQVTSRCRKHLDEEGRVDDRPYHDLARASALLGERRCFCRLVEVVIMQFGESLTRTRGRECDGGCHPAVQRFLLNGQVVPSRSSLGIATFLFLGKAPISTMNSRRQDLWLSSCSVSFFLSPRWSRSPPSYHCLLPR